MAFPNLFKRSGKSEFMRPRTRGFGGPLMFVVVVVAVIFVMSVMFRISDIQVVGNTHYTDDEIIRALVIEEGDNLFFFDKFAAAGRAYSKLPYIENLSVERALPNKIVITVEESTAMAYLELGDEQWTLDHSCKVLGKAAEGETEQLIPVTGMNPGTLMIGETMQTASGDTAPVEYLAEVLSQIQDRNLARAITRINFANPNSPEFNYGSKYTVVLGSRREIEHKFGMFIAVLDMLKDGDVGVIDVSDGEKAYFSPN